MLSNRKYLDLSENIEHVDHDADLEAEPHGAAHAADQILVASPQLPADIQQQVCHTKKTKSISDIYFRYLEQFTLDAELTNARLDEVHIPTPTFRYRAELTAKM